MLLVFAYCGRGGDWYWAVHFDFFFFFFLFCLFRAAPADYGGSQASSRIGTVGAGLRHSHSNAGSESSL